MKRLLIVDDDEMVLSGLAATMEEGGLKVDTAGSGHTAIELLSRETFDLVLTDLVMEDGDGLLLMRRMAERWPDIPVVVLTGHGTAESAMEAVRNGAADFIQKPARPEEIRERIAGVFAARELRRRMEDARDHARSQQMSTDARAARRTRMHAVRRVAEGVADDVAVLLPSIERHAEKAPDAREALGRIREMLAWIRPAAEPAAGVARLDAQLNAVLKSAAFRTLLDEAGGLRFETRLTEGLPPIRLAAPELRDMMCMLLKGAIQAAGKMGRLTVSVGVEEVDGPFGHCFEGVTGRYQYLRLQHSGYIRPEDLEHLFEPYYALKRMGRTAAGAFGYVRLHDRMHDAGGVLEVRSEERLGTELSLFFPCPADAEGAVPAAETDAPPAGHALAVDDDPAALEQTSRLLERLGYQVHPAAGVTAAIELCAARRERGERRFDVAVIDLMLGEIEDGVDLFRRLRDIEPHLSGVLMSGFADIERIADARKLGLLVHVQKPLTREALAKALRTVLTPH